MSNIATITFTSDGTAGQLRDVFVDSNPSLVANKMQNYLSGLAGGSYAASIGVKLNTGNAVSASKTVTLTSPLAGDILIINGVSFIAGTDWVIGTDAVSTSNLATVINASSNGLISGLVSASASTNILTISADIPGVSGNMVTLEVLGTTAIAVAGAGVAASGTLVMATVADAATAVINGTTLTAVDKKEKTQVTAVADLGAFEAITLTAIADTGVVEVQTITVPTTAAATQGDYFVLTNTAGSTVALWLNIDANGTPPSGAAYTAANSKITVNIVTGGTAAANAAILTAAAASILGWTAVDNLNGTVTYTQGIMGNVTAAATHNENDGGAGSFSQATDTGGASSNLLNTYLLFSLKNTGGATETNYYLWMNVNSEGADPAPGGTGIALAIPKSSTASAIGTLMRASLSAVSAKATITGATTQAIITGLFMGNPTNATDTGTTGFTIGISAGVASNLLNSYLTFYSAVDATKYGIWYNVNSEGSAPAIAGVSAGNRVSVSVAAGASANAVAAATRAVFLLSPLVSPFVESGATDKFIFRNVLPGLTTDAADGATATGFAFSVLVAGATVSAVQFQITNNNTTDAVALAALINAQSATLDLIVVATPVADTVTVTSIREGIAGNSITLSATGGITAGAARLAGGTEPGMIRLAGGTAETDSTTYNFGR